MAKHAYNGGGLDCIHQHHVVATMKTGMIFIMAVLVMNLVIAGCAIHEPVKEPKEHKTFLPKGSIIVETVDPVFIGEEEGLIFSFKDQCYLLMPTLVDGIYKPNMTRTWCP